MNNWQHNAKKALKGAQQCNDFFQSNQFEDGSFSIKIPLEFAQLVNGSDVDDPLLKQVIPQKIQKKSEFNDAPLADESYSPVPGLIHKYPNRVLLIASQVCAIHCQYCFRQNFNYSQHDAISNWDDIQSYIHNNPQINEVILSGGDPLSLSDDKLASLVANIEQISFIKTLRIHTRSAVVTPSRVTDRFISILQNSRLNTVLVFHINHPRELSAAFIDKTKELKNITLLNQSVLLKGVNDNFETLKQLSLALFDYGILPYYLHMLDKVTGSEVFLVEDKIAIQLHQKLQSALSGYLVPKLVRDEAQQSKTWLF